MAGEPAGQEAYNDTSIDTTIGGTAVQLHAPPGQESKAAQLAPLLTLHGISGNRVEVLAVFLTPETAQYYKDPSGGLPPGGLMSTMVITEQGLDNQYLDTQALRDVLVDEMKERKERTAFLASRRFGAEQLAVALPNTRLLALEDFLVIEAKERVLPSSGRRFSYCVEGFLALRNRAVLTSTCLTKPEIGRDDTFRLENTVTAWARQLQAQNPSSRSPAPRAPAALRPTGGAPAAGQPAKRIATLHLRAAADQRRQDVVVLSTLLWSQLPAALRRVLDKSNDQFSRNVATVCAKAADSESASQCELTALERRMRALEQCSRSSVAPLLQSETVEALVGQMPET